MKSIFSLIVFLTSLNANAFQEKQFKVGIESGHVGLQQDVGSAAGNAIGVGALLGYQVSDSLQVNLGYLQSYHTNLKHQDVNVGLDWYFNSYDAAYFFASAGTDFIFHELTSLGTTANGFGLFAGLGTDIELGPNFMLGLTGRYHNAFEKSVTPTGTTTPVKAIQNYVTVGLRFTIAFGGSKQ